MTPEEHARRVFALYSRDIICAGEAWGQIVDIVTTESVEVYLSLLPDDLRIYFRDTSLGASIEGCKTEQQRRGLLALKTWYRGHEIA